MNRFKNLVTAKEESAEIKENKLRNEAVLTDLYFQMFKQLAWLGSAIIGGTVILMRMDILELDKTTLFGIGLIAFTILNSIFCQVHLVEELAKGKTIYQIKKTLSIMLMISILALGAGVGSLSKELAL